VGVLTPTHLFLNMPLIKKTTKAIDDKNLVDILLLRVFPTSDVYHSSKVNKGAKILREGTLCNQKQAKLNMYTYRQCISEEKT